jgi:hypothetical protein
MLTRLAVVVEFGAYAVAVLVCLFGVGILLNPENPQNHVVTFILLWPFAALIALGGWVVRFVLIGARPWRSQRAH